ncbi:hypothetical protein M5D96_010754, partial [Drosophila gunungcola]
PVAATKKRSGPLDDALDTLNNCQAASQASILSSKEPQSSDVLSVRSPTHFASNQSGGNRLRRCSTKDKEKKRERWLLTRKTWSAKTVRPDQTSSPSAQRPILKNKNDKEIMKSSSVTLESELVSRLKLLSKCSIFGQEGIQLELGDVPEILEDKTTAKCVLSEKKTERSLKTCGTQTSFIQLSELKSLAEQYKLAIRNCDDNLQILEELDKQDGSEASRLSGRKSSIDDDISQSVKVMPVQICKSRNHYLTWDNLLLKKYGEVVPKAKTGEIYLKIVCLYPL